MQELGTCCIIIIEVNDYNTSRNVDEEAIEYWRAPAVAGRVQQ